MANTSSMRAPKGAVGDVCRRPRGRGEAPFGLEWMRPYKRAQRALDNAASGILACVRGVFHAGRCAAKPVRSTWMLTTALKQVTAARRQADDARRDLAEAVAAFAALPPELQSAETAELLELAQERCRKIDAYIYVAVSEVLLGEVEIINGVASGEVVPEDPSEVQALGRPRRRIIVRAPRPHFVRAFLASRQRRVADRITPVLLRRRRSPLPAEVRVPRPCLRDRAPPLASLCSL
jgi:hypothetical protein